MKQPTREEQQAERKKQNDLLRAYGYHWKRTDQLTDEQRSGLHTLMQYVTDEPQWVLLSPLEMPVTTTTILRWLGKRSANSEDIHQFLREHGFLPQEKDEHHIWHIQAPDETTVNMKQALQMIEQKRIDQANESERAWKQQFAESLERSAASLKEALNLHGQARNETHAWGYSPFPAAKRLPDGTIEVTTYHLEGEWRTTILHTELEVVDYLYTEDEGGWEPGEWQAA